MKYIYIIIILLLGLTQIVFAQNLSTRNVITAAGDYIKKENGASLSWTMGEVFSQTIIGKEHFTEGFQQGNMLKQPTLILDFTADRQDFSTVLLDWSTKGNLGENGFIIQRRLDNEIDFATIAFINSEEIEEKITFQIEDENEHFGISYYRIEYTFNKNTQWSPVKNVKGIDLIEQITTFPNPTTDYINLKIETTNSRYIETLNVIVYDVMGKQVLPTMSIDFNNEIIKINTISQLNSGYYTLQTIVNGQPYKGIKFMKI